jgi:hypothetical protein
MQDRVTQDNASRWRIDSPDFVFGMGSDAVGQGEKNADPSPQMHAQLLGAELMAEEVAPTPRAAVELPQAEAMEPVPAPEPVAAVTEMAAADIASPLAAPALDLVPPTEIVRPNLRIAREAMNQRPLRYGSLTVSDALSEDEVIALFG